MTNETSGVLIAWAEGVRAELDTESDALLLIDAARTARIARPPAWLVKAAHAFAGGGIAWGRLARAPGEDAGALASLRVRAGLARLAADRWIRAQARLADRVVAESVPGARGVALPAALSASPVVSSRFAYARVEDGALIVRSPASMHAVALREPLGAAIFAALATPRAVADLAAASGTSTAVAHDVASLLVAAGLACEPGVDPAPETWDFHDLLFHTRSRLGRVDAPAGATGRRAHLPSLPAVVDRSACRSIALAVPDLAAARRREPPFAGVVEERTSQRRYGDAPISRDQLGELLYRCARTRRVESAGGFEIASRPYPSAGALYEQEIYAVVHRASGLERGVYAYDGFAHALVPVAEESAAMDGLLAASARATGQGETPQVLLVITARFARVARKYESVAYALILKSAGALLQTLSLVAHAMGLAGCPLGAGDSEAFASIIKADFFEESSVAELALGTCATRRDLAEEVRL